MMPVTREGSFRVTAATEQVVREEEIMKQIQDAKKVPEVGGESREY